MTYVKLILFIVAILISVLGGKKLKINAGLIAIGFAFIFGVTITGLGVNGVVNLFSARLFVNMFLVATVYKGNIIKNLIMDCQSYTKYRPNETTGGIFVSWRRKEELPTGA